MRPKFDYVRSAKLMALYRTLPCQHCGAEPLCVMTGGAGWKMAPHMSVPFELVDNLIFDGLLQLAAVRFPI